MYFPTLFLVLIILNPEKKVIFVNDKDDDILYFVNKSHKNTKSNNPSFRTLQLPTEVGTKGTSILHQKCLSDGQTAQHTPPPLIFRMSDLGRLHSVNFPKPKIHIGFTNCPDGGR